MKIHLSLLVALAATALPLAAQAQEAFYEGKTVTILVGFGAGGGYDSTARLFARHLGEHLEGNPEIIVENMPGAGSLIAAGTIYNVSPKDGTVLGVIGGGTVLEAALGISTTIENARDFNWIGGRTPENSVCIVSADAGVETLEAAMEASVAVGATGPGARSMTVPKLLNSLLDTRFGIISGYPGSNEIFFATENGEVDGQCGIAWGTARQRVGEEIADGDMIVLTQFGLNRAADLPDVPLAGEFADSNDERAAIDFLQADSVLAWPLVAPPGLPEDRVEELRTAFAAMLIDEEFLAEAAQLGMDVEPVSGEEIDALIETLYSTPEDIKDIVRTAFE